MDHFIPYTTTEQSRCIASVRGDKVNLHYHLHGNCQNFAFALAIKYDYNIALIVDEMDDSWYFVHALAYYIDKKGITHYIDVRGQSTSFDFLESEFGYAEEDDTFVLGDNCKVFYLDVKSAIDYLNKHEISVNLTPNIDILETLNAFDTYYEPKEERDNVLDTKISIATSVLENDILYNQLLIDNYNAVECRLCSEYDDVHEAIAYYISSLLQLELVGFGTSRVTLRYEDVVFKVSACDEHNYVSALECGVQEFLEKKGHIFAPKLYFESQNLVVSEYVPPISDKDDFLGELEVIKKQCSRYGIALDDVTNYNQFGRRSDGQLVLLDWGNCDVTDTMYDYMIETRGRKW